MSKDKNPPPVPHVLVSREAARLGASALRDRMKIEAYHTDMAAEAELRKAAEEEPPSQQVFWTSPGQLLEIERGGNGTVTKHGDEFMCVPLYVGTPAPETHLVWSTPMTENYQKPVGYVEVGELAHLKLGASCVDLFRDPLQDGFQTVPLYEHPAPAQQDHLEKFNPAIGSQPTADQMAAVMLLHGTPEQQREALSPSPQTKREEGSA